MTTVREARAERREITDTEAKFWQVMVSVRRDAMDLDDDDLAFYAINANNSHLHAARLHADYVEDEESNVSLRIRTFVTVAEVRESMLSLGYSETEASPTHIVSAWEQQFPYMVVEQLRVDGEQTTCMVGPKLKAAA